MIKINKTIIKIYLLNKLSTIVYCRSLEFFHLVGWKLYNHWRATPHIPLPQLLATTTILLFASVVWLLQISHISGTMHYLSSCAWLISLNILSSKFIYVVAYDRISFFFKGWIIFHCMYVHIFFILSSINGYLHCFQLLAVINNASANVGMQLSLECAAGWLALWIFRLARPHIHRHVSQFLKSLSLPLLLSLS